MTNNQDHHLGNAYLAGQDAARERIGQNISRLILQVTKDKPDNMEYSWGYLAGLTAAAFKVAEYEATIEDPNA